MGYCAICMYPGADGTVNCKRCTEYSKKNKNKWKCKEDKCEHFIRIYRLHRTDYSKKVYESTGCLRPDCIRNGGWSEDLYQKRVEE